MYRQNDYMRDGSTENVGSGAGRGKKLFNSAMLLCEIELGKGKGNYLL